jgi:hypothetical protein
MKRFLRATALLVLVAACGSANFSAPRNLNNACSIVKERPAYLKAMQRSERKWGVPVAVQMATIYQESKFIGNARPPHNFLLGVIPMGRQSSAFGYSQALDATWDEYRQDAGAWGAKRNNINDAADFIGWYMSESTDRLGISKADARNQYLAYHEGRGGFSRGSYRSKGWLQRVASEVQSRSYTYDAQLASCSRR